MEKLPFSTKKIGQLPPSVIDDIKEELTYQKWYDHKLPNFRKGGSQYIAVCTTNGEDNNDHEGPFKVFTHLPETLSLWGQLNISMLRVRYMRLNAGGKVPEHTDALGWDDKARIHIPIQTDKHVYFYCGNDKVNMKEGEVWLIDNYDPHKVENNSETDRIHLVIDVYLNEIDQCQKSLTSIV